MKKLLKSGICGTREQYTSALFMKDQSNVAADKKKKKKRQNAKPETQAQLQLNPNTYVVWGSRKRQRYGSVWIELIVAEN